MVSTVNPSWVGDDTNLRLFPSPVPSADTAPVTAIEMV